MTEPAKVVIDGEVNAPQVRAVIDRLRRDLDGRSPFGPATLEENDAGDLAVLSVPVGSDAESAEAVGAVRCGSCVTGSCSTCCRSGPPMGCSCLSSSRAMGPACSAWSRSARSRPGCRCFCSRFGAACHYKDGTFVFRTVQERCPGSSPETGAAFNFWHPDLVTLHVWLWYPNPAGLYNGTNPYIKPFNRG
jgi:hypothetical protein